MKCVYLWPLAKPCLPTHPHKREGKVDYIVLKNRMCLSQRLALKLQSYKGELSRHKKRSKLFLLSPFFLCTFFVVFFTKREQYQSLFFLDIHSYVRSLPFQVIKLCLQKADICSFTRFGKLSKFCGVHFLINIQIKTLT